MAGLVPVPPLPLLAERGPDHGSNAFGDTITGLLEAEDRLQRHGACAQPCLGLLEPAVRERAPYVDDMGGAQRQARWAEQDRADDARFAADDC